MSVLTSNRTELPMKLETATNITLSADSLEAEDNMGRFEIMKPPGAWKDFYDRMLGEKGGGNKRKATNFTTPFLGERYRCILANSAGGQVITMRQLMKEIPRLEQDLGFDWNVIRPLLEGSGLTIFAGQMNSGKSTTMISAIDRLGRARRGNLGTVEDPIEVEFTGGGVIQREVGTHVDSFSEAIRDFVRQYRKTIMVGEIRDPETAEAAVLAASLGHSVVGTLHADSAIDIPTRMSSLLDTKLGRILPSVLRGMWWQHVYRRGDHLSKPLPIYESLYVTNSVRQIIADGPEKLPQLMNEMVSQKRVSMAQSAIAWINKGLATREELRPWLETRGRINDAQLSL
ncbi:ATPase, T2SS/T4P/T4SS family [Pseudomonas mosselii]|uniref:ATPase, T2SS/T4P/T4SS family n=1 Tax=Pseudomonas mosselii TaxID=78327 RepID=UPI0021D8E4D0|nr:ATPase, T2SS/T4P/T4SS family [Pseudomonas mosselii]MCU9528094.1 ATPase, T2SS/T4P/T4SS family [Pseudomonas mosselii]MCU9535202.1 ATPase, T2SS/T4P/T4SS family [Pseudomonas mosselii]MCU9542976.1 ATPase, T2SS/T4P/T4SS family [Pseudomonas mosselii]MCU9546938.1 ATPase, T2SS/T4P/T4SS family [Pseudomonas mosselii]